jgi:hypothetical protein
LLKLNDIDFDKVIACSPKSGSGIRRYGAAFDCGIANNR